MSTAVTTRSVWVARRLDGAETVECWPTKTRRWKSPKRLWYSLVNTSGRMETMAEMAPRIALPAAAESDPFPFWIFSIIGRLSRRNNNNNNRRSVRLKANRNRRLFARLPKSGGRVPTLLTAQRRWVWPITSIRPHNKTMRIRRPKSCGRGIIRI